MKMFCRTVAALVLAVVGAVFVLTGCSTKYPHRNPMGEAFPQVKGESLEGQSVALPADYAGQPVLLFIGFKQETQFDIDRWLLALTDTGSTLRMVEVPTIPGLMPGLFANSIDSGMRSGIPKEDWASVVTVYGDAELIARFTGNENGLPARVVLLDGTGRVVFFHDRGFSVASLKALQAAAASIGSEPVRRKSS